ncbi:methyl-accepting chemotaxis protein [Limnoraphis robusta]|uniref:Methyl-accepting chemotaxis protein n=1 Tax=Limnoraphis robusta CCNP1315 TaxID=3110306 RepID=A0ABU5U5N5_9CYAN|nr:methyl-accepting chemotaxis protein [Limnoraphis robusta]MEA5522466.1 methyl-accepting chemotaxis protein [Limnoraphis robusta CCNP1315]MEA5546224.1 methyl-accepting chemotaxis protein [Limnoraphis robusta CCNP1324]
MPASTDFLQEYQQTEAAYTQGNYEEAAALVYRLVEDYPDDPSARLLCGHIYGYGLQQYDVAREQYLAVLDLTDDAELLEQAQASMEMAEQYLADSAAYAISGDLGLGVDLNDDDDDDIGTAETRLDLEEMMETGVSDVDLDDFADHSEPLLDSEMNLEELEELSLEEIDLSEADFGLEDLSNDGQLDEFTDIGNLPNSLTDQEADDDHNPLADNPFGQSDQSQDLAEELELVEDEAITTQLESDPFQLDDQYNSDDEIEQQLLQPLENWSGNLLAQEANPNFDQPQSNFLQATSSEVLDLDDLMELDDLEDDENYSPVAPHSEKNGRSSASKVALKPTPNVTEDSDEEEGIDLDEFNSDLDDIFQSLEDSADLNLHSSNTPPHANGKSYSPQVEKEDEDFDEDLFSLEDIQQASDAEAETLLMSPSGSDDDFQFDENEEFALQDLIEDPDLIAEDDLSQELLSSERTHSQQSHAQNGSLDNDALFDASEIPDSFGLDAFDDDSFGEQLQFSNSKGINLDKQQHLSDDEIEPDDEEVLTTDSSALDENDFLDNFDEFDDLGNLPDFEASRSEEASFISDSSDFNEEVDSDFVATASSALERDNSAISNDELFNVPLDQEVVTTFTSQIDDPVETSVTVEQGPFAFLENKVFKTKFLYIAIGTGVATLIFVATATNIMTRTASLNQRREVVNSLRTTGWIVTLVSGATSFLSAWTLGDIAARQMSKASKDLQHQFDAISRHNLKARATVYAIDELGQMSAKFNHMAKFIETTTAEAQRKAEEQEEAKENLQRQVIRLLDDVEGAARGDLTVTAEVTADVLGAVADSFNLTIQNLREIVVQVKQAARQVSKGATDSATFAKDVAGDALRQAEELAATLNSVQVLTDAIQRVADSAREAEEVARSAAAVATRGGEAVQMTVAGILKIRETVAETTREVKRLAESSQEISKIVAIISQIASRTNLLALNASIEAARAGEAGRGFAIVADEVRQLADRSAKSLKEIEQIVMQIQSQTNSVMMAMEEGNQQVIDGTRLAEQAKRSLDDIIQVTNRIDVLVRSITADTVEQNETARAVAQVMQAVEHSAQETSQEAHRVSNALSNLVGVARDLLTSVERFRVDSSERK